MATKFLDSEGLLYFWQKIKNTFVPSTRTVNGKALSADVTLSASDVGAVATQSGKGLSTNDYTTTEKNKLAGIATGAEVNVQADWNVTDTSSDAYIKNKPTIPSGVVVDTALSSTSTNPVQNKVINTALSGKASTDVATTSANGLMSTTDKTKLDGVSTGANKAEITVVSGGSSGAQGIYSLKIDSHSWGFYDLINHGTAGGTCPLDANGKVDASYLPSYVDDVIEAYARSGQTALSSTWLATGSASGTVITPEAGKIYVLMADSGDYSANTQFRWGGSAYVKLNDGGVSSITNAEIDTIVAS